MKKKNLIIILVVILIVMLIPIPFKLKDGGSTEYKALLYNVTKIHRINHQSSTGYEDGWKVEILGIQIYNKVNSYLEANNENLEYTYFYDKGYYFDFNIIEKISNKNDISNILKKINRLPDNIINKLESYNDDYFKEKNLIFIYFPMGSGTPTTSLSKINNKDDIEVIIKINDNEFGTDDMSGHLYIIEIKKNSKNIIVYSKTNDETHKILKSSNEFNKTYKAKKVSKSNNDSKCLYITLSSLEQNDEFEILFCDTDYITFEEDKMYKFTFTPYGTPSTENSIKNVMFGNFIKTKIEETTEIINEEIIVFQNEEYELIFDKNSIVNCIGLVYEFEDGTRVYTDYTNIKYKINNIEMPIIEALENGLLNIDDIKNYKEFQIFLKDDSKPLECND